MALDAAPPAPPRVYDRGEGFDFRAVPLDPSIIGTDALCVAGSVHGSEVACLTDRAYAEMQIVTGDRRIVEGEVWRVRIDGPGHATLIEKAGALPPPEPPSGCECRDPAPSGAPKPPPGYDFARVWKDHAWDSVRTCEVARVEAVARSDVFDAAVAPFTVTVWCRAGASTSAVIVGSDDYRLLLAIHEDDVIALRLYFVKRNDATALFAHTIARHYD